MVLQIGARSETPRVQAPRWLGLDDALALIRTMPMISKLETVDLHAGMGRVLAQDLVATAPVPPFDNSAMDGFAIRTGDVPPDCCLVVCGRSAAGHSFVGALPPGAAVRILTGAAIPQGADAVVMQEDTERLPDGRVRLKLLPAPGTNIRFVGEDVAPGTIVIARGAHLRPQDIGIAASLGRTRLPVFERLRVGVLATGDELRKPGEVLDFGMIYDSNRHAIAAALEALGAVVTDYGLVPDRQDAVRSALERASRDNALVVSSGGVSAGDEDHVCAAVSELGRLDLWKLAIKPGKPVAIGRLGDARFIGVPGNPVSAMIVFWLLARPMVLRLMGSETLEPARYAAYADFHVLRKPGRREFLRVRAWRDELGNTRLHLHPNASSGAASSLVWADGLADVSAELAEIQPGQILPYIPFSALSM